MTRYALLLCALPMVGVANTAEAQATVRLSSGSLLDSCTLTAETDGSLSRNSAGTELGSDLSGGSPATLAVVAVGTAPTLTFAAPVVDAPGGDTGTTGQIAYSSTGGANQDYTDTQSTTTSGVLLDLFTIHGRLQNEDGFLAGTYELTTVVTCSQ